MPEAAKRQLYIDNVGALRDSLKVRDDSKRMMSMIAHSLATCIYVRKVLVLDGLEDEELLAADNTLKEVAPRIIAGCMHVNSELEEFLKEVEK